jgi:hypothetical protein
VILIEVCDVFHPSLCEVVDEMSPDCRSWPGGVGTASIHPGFSNPTVFIAFEKADEEDVFISIYLW